MTEKEEVLKYLSAMRIIDFNKLGFVYAKETIDDVLKLIKSQQSELEKKDKKIDKIIEIISHYDIDFSNICEKRIVACYKCEYKRNDCIRKYFERKVENEN